MIREPNFRFQKLDAGSDFEVPVHGAEFRVSGVGEGVVFLGPGTSLLFKHRFSIIVGIYLFSGERPRMDAALYRVYTITIGELRYGSLSRPDALDCV